MHWVEWFWPRNTFRIGNQGNDIFFIHPFSPLSHSLSQSLSLWILKVGFSLSLSLSLNSKRSASLYCHQPPVPSECRSDMCKSHCYVMTSFCWAIHESCQLRDKYKQLVSLVLWQLICEARETKANICPTTFHSWKLVLSGWHWNCFTEIFSISWFGVMHQYF